MVCGVLAFVIAALLEPFSPEANKKERFREKEFAPHWLICSHAADARYNELPLRIRNHSTPMTPEYICSLASCDRPVAVDGEICQTCIELRDDALVDEFMEAVEAAKPGKPIVDWFQSLMHNGLHAVPQDEDTAGYKRLVFEGPTSRLVLNPRRSGDTYNASVTHLTDFGRYAEWTVLFDVNVPVSVVLATLQTATNP